MKKPLIKLTILTVFLGVFLAVAAFSQISAATIIVNPPFGDVEQGDDLKVDVVVQGSDELIDGVDANIAYDTAYLRVKEMKEGEFFSQYPTLKDDNGQVKITALGPKEGVKIFGDIVIASLVFEIMDSGDTKLTVAFEEGATSESNVAEHASGNDLLTAVTSGNYTVTATPERLQEARARRAKQSGIIPILIFIILVVIIGVGIWYYRKKRKPKEDYFVPEAFPMDEVPKSEDNSSEPPKDLSPPSS
jgi:hypothetical protein